MEEKIPNVDISKIKFESYKTEFLRGMVFRNGLSRQLSDQELTLLIKRVDLLHNTDSFKNDTLSRIADDADYWMLISCDDSINCTYLIWVKDNEIIYKYALISRPIIIPYEKEKRKSNKHNYKLLKFFADKLNIQFNYVEDSDIKTLNNIVDCIIDSQKNINHSYKLHTLIQLTKNIWMDIDDKSSVDESLL